MDHSRWLLAVAAALFSPALSAAELVRDAALIASMPIQGVTFDMTPKQAFETLRARGYQAGTITHFEDWQQDGIEFVRGTYGSGPDGYSSVTFSRRDQRMTHLAETWNRPQRHFDAADEVAQARRHFRITDEAPTCTAASSSAGRCRVQDAEDPQAVDLVYGLQVLPGILIRYVESKKAHAR